MQLGIFNRRVAKITLFEKSIQRENISLSDLVMLEYWLQSLTNRCYKI